MYDGNGNSPNMNVDITVGEIVKVPVEHPDAISAHRPEKKGASCDENDDDSATLASILDPPK